MKNRSSKNKLNVIIKNCECNGFRDANPINVISFGVKVAHTIFC